MKRILMAAATILVIAAPSFAMDVEGKWGIGFLDVRVPVGVRYWASENVGIEAGVGFSTNEQNFWDDANATYKKATATNFLFLVGVPYNVTSVGGGRARLNLIPFYRFESIGKFEDGAKADQWHSIALLLEFEAFLVDWMSVSAGHGLAVDIYKPGKGADGDPELETTVDFYSAGRNLTEIGVHFYFGGE